MIGWMGLTIYRRHRADCPHKAELVSLFVEQVNKRDCFPFDVTTKC
jgi:hypothetical protein